MNTKHTTGTPDLTAVRSALLKPKEKEQTQWEMVQSLQDAITAARVTNILHDHGVQVVSVTVIDCSLDSAGHVMENIDAMQGAKHVIVMNLGHVPGSMGERAFKPLFENAEFAGYVKQASLVVMPRLQDAIEIDAIGARLHSITSPDSPAASNPFMVSRTKTWLKAVTQELGAAIADE